MNPLFLNVPTEFSSDRLLLRRYQPEDSTAYCQMVQANRDHLREFMPPTMATVQTEADAAEL